MPRAGMRGTGGRKGGKVKLNAPKSKRWKTNVKKTRRGGGGGSH